MQEPAVVIINSLSLFLLGIFRYISTRIGPAPGEDAQSPSPAAFIQYKQYMQLTAEWMGEYWPLVNRWARSFLDCLLPNDGDDEEVAAHGAQPSPTNRGPHSIPATVVPRPPPPAHRED